MPRILFVATQFKSIYGPLYKYAGGSDGAKQPENINSRRKINMAMIGVHFFMANIPLPKQQNFSFIDSYY